MEQILVSGPLASLFLLKHRKSLLLMQLLQDDGFLSLLANFLSIQDLLSLISINSHCFALLKREYIELRVLRAKLQFYQSNRKDWQPFCPVLLPLISESASCQDSKGVSLISFGLDYKKELALHEKSLQGKRNRQAASEVKGKAHKRKESENILGREEVRSGGQEKEERRQKKQANKMSREEKIEFVMQKLKERNIPFQSRSDSIVLRRETFLDRFRSSLGLI